MTKSELYKNLLNEISRSIIIKPKEKDYWLHNHKFLPITAVEYFYNTLKRSNILVEKSIEAGMEKNPKIIKQITLQCKEVKRVFLKAKEKQQTLVENAEEILMKNLSKI